MAQKLAGRTLGEGRCRVGTCACLSHGCSFDILVLVQAGIGYTGPSRTPLDRWNRPCPAINPAAHLRAYALGGRFSESTDAFVQAFTASVSFDKRCTPTISLAPSPTAHAHQVGVLSEAECTAIIEGLTAIRSEIESAHSSGRSPGRRALNIEARLTERIGVAGKKLHTGARAMIVHRLRLYLRDEIDLIAPSCAACNTAAGPGRARGDSIMPASLICKSPCRSPLSSHAGLVRESRPRSRPAA